MSAPVRTCLGCGTKAGKKDLIRLALAAGELIIDDTGRKPGRGAYCCKKVECLQRALKQRKKLAWALRCQGQGSTSDFVIRLNLEDMFGSMAVDG